MIRGAQKKMIVIRTHDSRVFEEAYFVIRRDSEGSADSCDMLTEADRIIRRSTADNSLPDGAKKHPRFWQSRFFWLLVGVFTGGGGAGLAMLLL